MFVSISSDRRVSKLPRVDVPNLLPKKQFLPPPRLRPFLLLMKQASGTN
jgi:hypothetical protein